jgi:hypothetical protein
MEGEPWISRYHLTPENRIGPIGGEALFQAIAGNTTLTWLDIQCLFRLSGICSVMRL